MPSYKTGTGFCGHLAETEEWKEPLRQDEEIPNGRTEVTSLVRRKIQKMTIVPDKIRMLDEIKIHALWPECRRERTKRY